MKEDTKNEGSAEGLGPEQVEGELTWLRDRVLSLTDAENDGVKLRACKLYYDMICDAEAIGYESSRQHGRPLKIIFQGMEESD